ncbi:hypothetical protein [Sphingomonas faeni]|uniref:hypothetical protein n=1 Tax=Sphingomonas faeni TaxID=185950 RepID=UPI0033594ADE
MNGVTIVPIVTLILVFGVPYIVIYLQGRRLAAIEARLGVVLEKLNFLEGRGS